MFTEHERDYAIAAELTELAEITWASNISRCIAAGIDDLTQRLEINEGFLNIMWICGFCGFCVFCG